jgi:hypothetical protein
MFVEFHKIIWGKTHNLTRTFLNIYPIFSLKAFISLEISESLEPSAVIGEANYYNIFLIYY